jgi:hypothetical protein
MRLLRADRVGTNALDDDVVVGGGVVAEASLECARLRCTH